MKSTLIQRCLTWLFVLLLAMTLSNPVLAQRGNDDKGDNDKPVDLEGFTSARLFSESGRYELAFNRVKDKRYRIVSTSRGQDKQIYQTFGRDTVSFFNPRNGDYQYVLEACADPNPFTRCLAVGNPLNVTVGLTPVSLNRNTCTTGNDCGGADQLQPGQWWNPAKEGHGWDL